MLELLNSPDLTETDYVNIYFWVNFPLLQFVHWFILMKNTILVLIRKWKHTSRPLLMFERLRRGGE